MIVSRIPQNPVSRLTEKQLLSWLKATDNDTGPADSSMAGLVFMTAETLRLGWYAPMTTASSQERDWVVIHEAGVKLEKQIHATVDIQMTDVD